MSERATPPPLGEDDAQAVASALTSALLPTGGVDPIERIVRATLELVAADGVAAVSFERVADRAEVDETLLDTQFDDVDHLIGVALDRSGAAMREVVESVDRPEDAVHLILPALATQSPYTQAVVRAVLDGYGRAGRREEFPLARHLVGALTRLRDEQGAGVVDPRVASAAIVTLATAWHMTADFIEPAYQLEDVDEVEVRRQLSTVLEAIVGLVTGPRIS